MSFVQKTLLGLAFAGTVGGWGYGRFGTEKTEEVTVLTVRDAATAEEQAEGKHAYRITTDVGGIFKNEGGILTLKFGTTTDDLQSYFKEGGRYKITSYDPLIGDKNVIGVLPVNDPVPAAGLSGKTKDVTLDFNDQSVVVQIPVEAEGHVVVKDIKGGAITAPPASDMTTGKTSGGMPGVPSKADLSVRPPTP